jgi:anti-sigma factor RsiW
MTTNHVPVEDLEFYVRGGLGPDRIPEVEAHLSGCAACTAKLEEAVQFVSQMARTKGHGILIGRAPVDDVAYMQLLKPLSLDRHAVRILSASREGLGLATNARLLPGDVVRVMIGETLILGEVSHCMTEGEEFHANVRAVRDQGRRSGTRLRTMAKPADGRAEP